ncbi:hypothetical protein AB1K54_09015 [Microbacterium sp. BWT-B31]|uniref:hypothetical protein n=1 Tax=Microbacterium sp. BWT-B31 TaxID=3232072 RepID=UPI003526F885
MTSSMPFDARPLTEPVDRAAVTQFVSTLRAQGRVPSGIRDTSGLMIVLVVGMLVMMGGGTLVTLITTVTATVGALGSGEGLGFTSFFGLLPFLGVGGLLTLASVGFVRARRKQRERFFRLDRFARANGMAFEPQLARPALPGMVFSIGSSRLSTDLVRGTVPRFVEFANYRYTTGSGKNRKTHQWGYVAVKLDVPLPHIVLDAQSNNLAFMSNLPATFTKDQRLSLEGDFDRHFALYCPVGYEADALYLFTPDIMARFIDNAAALDVEIVDDWLFLYAQRELSTLDPATWAWMFSVVAALLDKFAQWSRWRDKRLADAMASVTSTPAVSPQAPGRTVGEGTDATAPALPFAAPRQPLTPPPPGVAPQGRRLARRTSWVSIGIAAVIALFVVMHFVSGGLFSLLR